MKFLISVTTYMKNDALDVILQSLVDNKYFNNSELIICDDGIGNAKDIYNKFSKLVPRCNYTTGKHRMGIAGNKNRGIKFFIECSNAEYLVLLDDDIKFLKSGMFDRMASICKQEKIQHCSGYLGDYEDPLSKSSFFTTFPIQGVGPYTDKIAWCPGSQGLALVYKRDVVLKAKYFPKMPYFYGMEHSAYDAHCNRLEGRNPLLHPLFVDSPLYFETQMIPNNYDLDREKIYSMNGVAYDEIVRKIMRGTYFSDKHHIKEKDEILISNV